MAQDNSHVSFETSLRDQLRAAADAAQSQILTAENYTGPPTDPELIGRDGRDYELEQDVRPPEVGHEPAEHPQLPPREPAPKRELRKTKRAAQNRAAQRAFRERQSRKMNLLQDRAIRFEDLERNFRYLERQNFIMQTYIMTLQNKLSEYTSDIPPIPDEPGPDFVPRPENPEDLDLEHHDQMQGQEVYATSPVEYAEPPLPPQDEPHGEYEVQHAPRSPQQHQAIEQEVQPPIEPALVAAPAPMAHVLDDVEARVQQQLSSAQAEPPIEQHAEQQVVEALNKAE